MKRAKLPLPKIPLRSSISLAPGSAAALLAEFQRAAAPLWQAFGRGRLPLALRRALGGHLFAGAAGFVSAVAEALIQEPALFTHLPVRGAALLSDQDEALDLLFLCQSLRELHDVIFDAYLQKQSGAIQDALLVMERQRLEGKIPHRGDGERADHARREDQLHPAQKVLTERQRRRRRSPVR
jgi:hypothetical protein